MTHITKHDSKEKWESHTCQVCWIGLLIVGHTVSVDNQLENLGKFISFQISWPCDLVVVVADHAHSWIDS